MLSVAVCRVVYELQKLGKEESMCNDSRGRVGIKNGRKQFGRGEGDGGDGMGSKSEVCDDKF